MKTELELLKFVNRSMNDLLNLQAKIIDKLVDFYTDWKDE